MIRKVSYESQERREKQVLAALNANGIQSLEEANQICEDAGVDPYQMCEDTQRICFENAKWAYVAGAAIAIKKGVKTAADAAEAIGIGLHAFCIPGSVADDRKVGLGHEPARKLHLAAGRVRIQRGHAQKAGRGVFRLGLFRGNGLGGL